MRRIGIVTSELLLLCLPVTLSAQQRVNEGNLHERVWAIVPMVGAGTYDDPRRPLFAPEKTDPNGIIQFTYELSDDGRTAIVELVARDRKALADILESRRADVKVFLKGRDRKEDIEREFRRVKPSFDADKFVGKGGR